MAPRFRINIQTEADASDRSERQCCLFVIVNLLNYAVIIVISGGQSFELYPEEKWDLP